MPEGPESEAMGQQTQKFHEEHQSEDTRRVRALHADGTQTEVARAKKGTHLSKGHVSKLDATCTWKRGNVKSQTGLWPPMWRKLRSQQSPPSIEELQLKNIQYTSRTLILDLGSLKFQVWLTNFLSYISIVETTKLQPSDSISDPYFRPMVSEGTMGQCCL